MSVLKKPSWICTFHITLCKSRGGHWPPWVLLSVFLESFIALLINDIRSVYEWCTNMPVQPLWHCIAVCTSLKSYLQLLTCTAVASLTVPGGTEVPFAFFSPQILIDFSYFSSNFSHFLPHFGPPGGRLAHSEDSGYGTADMTDVFWCLHDKECVHLQIVPITHSRFLLSFSIYSMALYSHSSEKHGNFKLWLCNGCIFSLWHNKMCTGKLLKGKKYYYCYFTEVNFFYWRRNTKYFDFVWFVVTFKYDKYYLANKNAWFDNAEIK